MRTNNMLSILNHPINRAKMLENICFIEKHVCKCFSLKTKRAVRD